MDLSAEKLGLWTASTANYAYWWKRLQQDRDPTKIVGQDNIFRYLPRKKIALRIDNHSDPFEALRVCAAALTCGAPLHISFAPHKKSHIDWSQIFSATEESESQFCERLKKGEFDRIRMVEAPSKNILEAAAESATYIMDEPVLANGRYELLHYLREVAISHDYHRYGNLGLREGELRKPIL
jgi:RHH-type proline utilization regulon transcriptional repressor/proline dehydrogenase/delta 1-pyrroline-5-carboxylate dehydrogenase